MGSIFGGVRRAMVLSVALVLLGAQGAAAAPHAAGSLDHSFNGTGRTTVGFGVRIATAQDAAMQGRKIVVAGGVGFESRGDTAIVRLTADGQLDRTFGGGDGSFVRNVFDDFDIANDVEVIRGGKILAAGQGYDPVAAKGRFFVLRLTPDGRLDHTFGGGDGIVITRFGPGGAFGHAMTVFPDGRFVVCGLYAGTPQGFALAAYRPNGSVDGGFGLGGGVVTTFPGQTEGADCQGVTHVGPRVVAVGYADDGTTRSIAVAKYLSTGMPDTGFDADGRALYTPVLPDSEGADVVAQPDGKVVLTGTVSDGVNDDDIVLMQLLPNGNPDPGFGGGDGVFIDDLGRDDHANGLVRQRDGKLIVVGFRTPYMFVARYKPFGARDTGFGKHGVQASRWSAGLTSAAAAVLAKGTVVAVGGVQGSGVRFAIERLFT